MWEILTVLCSPRPLKLTATGRGKARLMSLSLRRRRSPKNSRSSRVTTNDASVRLYWKPTLGDKLQRLGQRSRPHLLAVELLVDQMLRTLKAA